MKISDFLEEKAIETDLKSTEKEGVLKELVALLAGAGAIKDEEEIIRILLERETLGSTGIGNGVAMPHGKSGNIKKLTAALGICRNGIDFNSLDGKKVYIVFLLVAPEEAPRLHLKALARISRLLRDKFFRDRIKSAPNKEMIIDIINEFNQDKLIKIAY